IWKSYRFGPMKIAHIQGHSNVSRIAEHDFAARCALQLVPQLKKLNWSGWIDKGKRTAIPPSLTYLDLLPAEELEKFLALLKEQEFKKYVVKSLQTANAPSLDEMTKAIGDILKLKPPTADAPSAALPQTLSQQELDEV